VEKGGRGRESKIKSGLAFQIVYGLSCARIESEKEYGGGPLRKRRKKRGEKKNMETPVRSSHSSTTKKEMKAGLRHKKPTGGFMMLRGKEEGGKLVILSSGEEKVGYPPFAKNVVVLCAEELEKEEQVYKLIMQESICQDNGRG